MPCAPCHTARRRHFICPGVAIRRMLRPVDLALAIARRFARLSGRAVLITIVVRSPTRTRVMSPRSLRDLSPHEANRLSGRQEAGQRDARDVVAAGGSFALRTAGTSSLSKEASAHDALGMKARFPRFGAVVGSKAGYHPADRAEPLAGAGRACCCVAWPVVTVVMPPAPGRPHPVDLLLCGHHYRVCRAAVAAAGAAVYDELGAPVRTDVGGSELACREPADAAPRR